MKRIDNILKPELGCYIVQFSARQLVGIVFTAGIQESASGCIRSPGELRTSASLAEALLREAHVAVTPGEAFDAPGYLRISYATSLVRLREGVTRIKTFMQKRRNNDGE